MEAPARPSRPALRAVAALALATASLLAARPARADDDRFLTHFGFEFGPAILPGQARIPAAVVFTARGAARVHGPLLVHAGLANRWLLSSYPTPAYGSVRMTTGLMFSPPLASNNAGPSIDLGGGVSLDDSGAHVAFEAGGGVRAHFSREFSGVIGLRYVFEANAATAASGHDAHQVLISLTYGWHFGTPTPSSPREEPPPRPQDADHDGVADAIDACPTAPEDRDGFQDDDGCPEPDNDGDDVPDTADQCPMHPEVYNGHQDQDGCPDAVPDQGDPVPVATDPTPLQRRVR